MADTSVSYSGDGATTSFGFTFPYLDRSHILVFVDGVLQVLGAGVGDDYDFTDDQTIEFQTAPASDADILIKRRTPLNDTEATNTTVPIVDFTTGAAVTERDLDQAKLESLYWAQELRDALEADLLVIPASGIESDAQAVPTVANGLVWASMQNIAIDTTGVWDITFGFIAVVSADRTVRVNLHVGSNGDETDPVISSLDAICQNISGANENKSVAFRGESLTAGDKVTLSIIEPNGNSGALIGGGSLRLNRVG